MRITFIKIIYVLILFAITYRLFYWQIIRSDDLTARAQAQHLISYTLGASRGLIFSSDHSLLAGNKPSYLLYADPKQIQNPDQVASELALILYTPPVDGSSDSSLSGIDDLRNQLKAELSQNLEWVSLAKDLDITTKQKIDNLNITGLGFEDHQTRFYPEASSSAHILGFVASDALGQPTGYFGVEGYYNGDLKGVGGVETEEKDAFGIPILTGKFFERAPQNGHNLVLNIDRTVQFIVEQNLKEGMTQYGAKSASAIVMDPKTGGILALASYPSYDPNHYKDFPKQYFTDTAVADSYEPGSTFKVLVMGAAINEKLVTPDTKCDICSGPVEASGYLIRTWDNKYFPNTTMTDVIVHSDNTGMTFVARKLGLDKMYQYIQNYGFGEPTGVDLQDESSPELRPKKDWYEVDLATAAFGQGIAVTPLQLVRAVATIANGGYLMEPHVVKQIETGEKTIAIKPKIDGQPISQKTAQTMTDMMVKAVDEGESKFFALPRYTIAGKTGTAQIAIAGHYDPTHTIASFVGFAPAHDPRFVMLVRYDEPSASIYGAETAAPTFFNIAKQFFIYYNIPPDR